MTCKDCLHYEVCKHHDAVVDFPVDDGVCRFFEERTKWMEQKHGRWELTAHDERCNYRWNVTAECSECHHEKGEIYAGFFPGFPKDVAEAVILDCAASVKLDNYCPNCGADMREGSVGE